MQVLTFLMVMGLALLPSISRLETQCTKASNGSITCREISTMSPRDLTDIYGDWNPEAYSQGRRQVEQSNLMQQERLKQLQLQNQYEAQNNALRLENQRLKNEALARENVDRRSRYGSEGVPLTAEQYQRLQSIGDEELLQMRAEGQKLTSDTDPVAQSKGQRLLQIARLAVELRRKQ